MTEYAVINEKCLIVYGITSDGEGYQSMIYPEGELTAQETIEKLLELTGDKDRLITIDEDDIEMLFRKHDKVHFGEVTIRREEMQHMISSNDTPSPLRFPNVIYVFFNDCDSLIRACDFIDWLSKKYANKVEIWFAVLTPDRNHHSEAERIRQFEAKRIRQCISSSFLS